ncbi:hypothetical protein SISNIDRAFT_453637 [Sistotremastrum niveocremeum HHB9708]|uniref:BSD domain-containing protein n=1 Tax=Sistotremastrum niveocremeum HHB9708 TaxID=1314777 RepID=A0A164V8L4_9AGAM|nr:hypothetical protein SISNIDRAFT_453637 [Sistotremastrum niveocremeum HHB9708]
MPSSTTLTAPASYKKLGGTLELTSSALIWTPEGKRVPTVQVPHAEASALFCSKEGAAQVRLKLNVLGDDQGHNFTFTSHNALAERDKFKQELTNIIGRNRASTVSTPVSAAPSPLPLPTAKPKPTAHTPLQQPSPRAISSPRHSSRANSRAPTAPPSRPPEDFRLRKKVLINNPDLATLHRELVIGGQISETEFWAGRDHLLLAESASENQKKGKSGQLVDPRPETVASGEIKIVITPQLVHDIFDEYPVVATAYHENVPDPLSEAVFWQRYFQSKLFYSHQASIRSSATQHFVKDDPIFDKYLQVTDDGLEPLRQRNEHVEKIIDLMATQEDHAETGNEKDMTMQAGRQKGALPLIRRFNEHSERLLQSALGDAHDAKRRRLNASDSLESQILLDDLQDQSNSNGISLDMQDRYRFFEGRSDRSAKNSLSPEDTMAGFTKMTEGLRGWEPALQTLKLDKKSTDGAVMAMTESVAARLNSKLRKSDIPEHLLRQMTTCQTAANEFLRQFWSAFFPPSHELQTAATSTPAQRAAKATKMIGFLKKTPEKIAALVQAAKREGVSTTRVEAALQPLSTSVQKALEFYNSRKH